MPDQTFVFGHCTSLSKPLHIPTDSSVGGKEQRALAVDHILVNDRDPRAPIISQDSQALIKSPQRIPPGADAGLTHELRPRPVHETAQSKLLGGRWDVGRQNTRRSCCQWQNGSPGICLEDELDFGGMEHASVGEGLCVWEAGVEVVAPGRDSLGGGFVGP